MWQSGFYWNDGYFDNNTPNTISGVNINTNFIAGPTGVAATGYHINYPLGQVIFDKAIPKTSKVSVSRAHRWCQIYKSSTDPYWKELQELTYKPTTLNQPKSGDYSMSSNHRVQMPAIIIEPIASSSSKGWQLGARDFMVSQDILLHVFTENGSDKNRITDILRLQKEATIHMYDLNKVVDSGVYPLDYRGSINPSGSYYHELSAENSDYFWNNTFIKDVNIIDMESRNKNLYWCTIRLTTGRSYKPLNLISEILLWPM